MSCSVSTRPRLLFIAGPPLQGNSRQHSHGVISKASQRLTNTVEIVQRVASFCAVSIWLHCRLMLSGIVGSCLKERVSWQQQRWNIQIQAQQQLRSPAPNSSSITLAHEPCSLPRKNLAGRDAFPGVAASQHGSNQDFVQTDNSRGHVGRACTADNAWTHHQHPAHAPATQGDKTSALRPSFRTLPTSFQ